MEWKRLCREWRRKRFWNVDIHFSKAFYVSRFGFLESPIKSRCNNSPSQSHFPPLSFPLIWLLISFVWGWARPALGQNEENRNEFWNKRKRNLMGKIHDTIRNDFKKYNFVYGWFAQLRLLRMFIARDEFPVPTTHVLPPYLQYFIGLLKNYHSFIPVNKK